MTDWLLLALAGIFDTLALWTLHLNGGHGDFSTAAFALAAIGTCAYLTLYGDHPRIVR